MPSSLCFMGECILSIISHCKLQTNPEPGVQITLDSWWNSRGKILNGLVLSLEEKDWVPFSSRQLYPPPDYILTTSVERQGDFCPQSLGYPEEIVPDSGQVLKSKGLSRPRGRSQVNQKQDVVRSILKCSSLFTHSCLLAKGASWCPASCFYLLACR